MSITINDPALLQKISESVGTIDVENPNGEIIATLSVFPDGKPPPGMQSPFTREEMAARRADKTPGRSLKDILADLRARG